jgi:hypothetical protein
MAGAIGVAVVVLAAGGAGAHHGWSGYDDRRPLTLTGTVKESGYEHPHGHVKLQVPDKVWHVVLAPPSRMERRGLTADALRPGASATVVGYPHRTEASELRAERITIGDKTIELR